MKTLTFQGYSDDTFACEGPEIDVDYDTCASGAMVAMEVRGDGEALLVTGQYAPGPVAGWTIGVGPVDGPDHDGQHIAPWPIRIEQSARPYSPQLVIEAPDDVSVTLLST